METYIVSVFAQPGHADEVEKIYRDFETLMKDAKGFRGRKMFRARTGTMAEAVHKLYTAEELAGHAEPPHEDPGTQFIIIEEWDSIDDRMLFSKNIAGSRQKELIPHLLPNHSHEFYEEFK